MSELPDEFIKNVKKKELKTELIKLQIRNARKK